MNFPKITNDQLIILFLGISLLLLIINNKPEYYTMILTGLLGFAGVNKFNQNRIESTIESSIEKNLNNGEDMDATKDTTC